MHDQTTRLFGVPDDDPPPAPAVDGARRRQEIAFGLRWPTGRRLDYDRDPYFQRHPLALTLPPDARTAS